MYLPSSRRAVAILAFCLATSLLEGCVTTAVRVDPEPDTTRGDVMTVGSSLVDGKALACRTARGICFSPTPERPQTACSCADESGVVPGLITEAVPTSAEATLASVVQVFYATDRNLEPGTDKVQFGTDRSTVSYGTARVSIPATHQTGFLEAPTQFVRIKFLENSKKHVVVLDVTRSTRDPFFQLLESSVRNAPRSEAFVFVHGFNVNFDNAVRRTGQIAFDLGFEGPPILYSWPSKGSPSPLGYSADSATVEWSKQLLKEFIYDVLEKTSVQNVYLIAHSMGNRPLTSAIIALMNEQPAIRSRIKEVILAAPDIDAEIFKRDIAPSFVQTGRRVTLYASSTDKTLILSRMANAIPRAGDSGAGLVVVNGIETIDASAVDTSFLGHSYFADTRAVMLDIRSLLFQGLSAGKRSGLRQMSTTRPYWEFRK